MNKRHTLVSNGVLYVVCLLLSVGFLFSCGADGRHFRIEGKFLNLNQGEFYVDSLDGGTEGLDTIKLNGGRFVYEVPCSNPTTLVMVYPNFSEQPIFAKPGKTVSVKGDASHLKEVQVKGTKDNEWMTAFRLQIANASPPEIAQYAEQFVKDHPASPASVYVVSKYFVQSEQPDYKKANELLELVKEAQPKNLHAVRLHQMLPGMKATAEKADLPNFSARDMNGKPVSSSTYKSAEVAVIVQWASWNYESLNMLRDVKRISRKAGGRLKVLSISMDAGVPECKKPLESDSLLWPNVCDGMMFDGDLTRSLALTSVPDNIVLQRGRVVGRSLPASNLRNKLEKMLNVEN